MNNKERIDQLLCQFMDRSEAETAADEIRAGDRLFAEHPAPAVSRKAIDEIHRRIAKQTRMHRLFGGLKLAGAAAAAVIMLALLHGQQSAPLPERQPVSISMPAAAQQVAAASVPEAKQAIAENLWKRLASHESLAQIDRELTDVADSIDALRTETYGELVNTLKIDMLELEELELITANTDFWKG